MPLSALFVLCSCITAYTLTGKVEFDKLPRDIKAENVVKSSISVFKLGETSEFIKSLTVDKSGAFSFTPASGSLFLLKARTPSVVFNELLVDTRSEAPVVSVYHVFNVTASRVVSEARFTPAKILVFEPPKEAFDALQFLKNPMVLFAGGMIILMTFLGRLQENMGEEADVRAAENKALVDQTMKIFKQ